MSKQLTITLEYDSEVNGQWDRMIITSDNENSVSFDEDVLMVLSCLEVQQMIGRYHLVINADALGDDQ